MQLTIITEQGNDGEIHGRIHFCEDLLTSSAHDIEVLKGNFIQQLHDFYGIDNVILKIINEDGV